MAANKPLLAAANAPAPALSPIRFYALNPISGKPPRKLHHVHPQKSHHVILQLLEWLRDNYRDVADWAFIYDNALAHVSLEAKENWFGHNIEAYHYSPMLAFIDHPGIREKNARFAVMVTYNGNWLDDVEINHATTMPYWATKEWHTWGFAAVKSVDRVPKAGFDLFIFDDWAERMLADYGPYEDALKGSQLSMLRLFDVEHKINNVWIGGHHAAPGDCVRLTLEWL